MTTFIDILPDDLLLDIFLVAKDCHSRFHPQIAISQVCRRWRSLALSNPLIWDKLHLEFNGTRFAISLSRNRSNTTIARKFCERSSPLPLDVVIVDKWASLDHQVYAELLEPCASRMRSLDMTRIRIYLPGLRHFFERVVAPACKLRSMKLSQYEVWNGGAMLLSEAPAPWPMQLENFALAPSMCIECLPFSLGSIAQLELRQFTPTRSRLSFLFRSMPMLSSLAIGMDQQNSPSQHHFYSHQSSTDFEPELQASSLIPSSSLRKLALIFTKGDQSKLRFWWGLEFLDVQKLKYLELRCDDTTPSKKSHRLSILQAWNDRLVSLETLVLSSMELLSVTDGSNQKFIGSSQPGGINLVIQTLPTFATHQRILSSFTEIASLTYYLPAVALMSPYHGPTDVKERLSTVSFPITFIPTYQWRTSFPDRLLHSHSLLMIKPMDTVPSCEAVEFIRHIVKIGRGGPIPVTFVDCPSSLPGLLTSRTQGDMGFDLDTEEGVNVGMMMGDGDMGMEWQESMEDFVDDI